MLMRRRRRISCKLRYSWLSFNEMKSKRYSFNLPDGVLNPIDVNDKRFGNVHVSVDNWKMMGKALSKMIVEVEGETWI